MCFFTLNLCVHSARCTHAYSAYYHSVIHVFMFFHSHNTFHATHQTQHRNVSEKGQFVHNVPETEWLNNWWSCFICIQFCALTFALDLAGQPRFMLASTCMYPHICYLIRNDMYINIYVSVQEVCLNIRQSEQVSF